MRGAAPCCTGAALAAAAAANGWQLHAPAAGSLRRIAAACHSSACPLQAAGGARGCSCRGAAAGAPPGCRHPAASSPKALLSFALLCALPGFRGRVITSRKDLWKGGPFKPLTMGLSRTGGRNAHGVITSRHRGGGHRKVRLGQKQKLPSTCHCGDTPVSARRLRLWRGQLGPKLETPVAPSRAGRIA